MRRQLHPWKSRAAKQQLVDAETENAAELEARKIALLCND